MSLSSTSKNLRFIFEGDNCLYRDHHGKRVIADVEGSGQLLVKGGEYELFVDGHFSEGNTFKEHLLVLSSSDDLIEVCVLLGSNPGLLVSKPAQGLVEACGWVISSDQPFTTDSSHHFHLPPLENFPVPFFSSVHCEGQMQIVLQKTASTKCVDAFDTFDLEALKLREWKVQNASDIYDLNSAFDDGTQLDSKQMSHLNCASWAVEIPPENNGLILRKLYDRFHGRQRARVLVDGAHAGWWYEPVENRTNRWAWASFGIPPELTKGKTSIRISIDPPAGVPLWNVSRLELTALIQQ